MDVYMVAGMPTDILTKFQGNSSSRFQSHLVLVIFQPIFSNLHREAKNRYFFEISLFALKHLWMVWVNVLCRKNTVKRVLRVITACMPNFYYYLLENSERFHFLTGFFNSFFFAHCVSSVQTLPGYFLLFFWCDFSIRMWKII